MISFPCDHHNFSRTEVVRFDNGTEHFWSGKEWFMIVDILVNVLSGVLCFFVCEGVIQIIKRRKR